MNCPNCNKDVDPNMNFCPQCGIVLNSSVPETPLTFEYDGWGLNLSAIYADVLVTFDDTNDRVRLVINGSGDSLRRVQVDQEVGEVLRVNGGLPTSRGNFSQISIISGVTVVNGTPLELKDKLTVNVTMPSTAKIVAGDQTFGTLTCLTHGKSLYLSLDGIMTFHGEGFDHLAGYIAGTGPVTINDVLEFLDLRHDSVSNLKIRNLFAKKAKIESSGVGDVTIDTCRNELELEWSGVVISSVMMLN